MLNTQQVLQDFIVSEFGAKYPNITINAETQLIKEGILDSLNLFVFITYIEDELDILVDPEDITPENFETLQINLIF